MTGLEDKLSRYKEPSSQTEKDKQDRAERMVKDAVRDWAGFEHISLQFLVKGSYANNTNVRADSDVDVAVIHEGYHYYDDSALRPANKIHGSVTFSHYSGTELRAELEKALIGKFGRDCDTSGNTALTIADNSSRVSADVVPSYKHVTYYYDSYGRVASYAGTVTYRKDGSSVVNYPEKQLANGKAKNVATNSRYKQVVRILKRIENELVLAGRIQALPSYLMECLVYPLDNGLFVAPSSSYTPLTDICRSVFASIWAATRPGDAAVNWREPNGIKPLFTGAQPWTMSQANALALEAFSFVNQGAT